MAATAQGHVTIRDMTLADVRQVRRIERAAYGGRAPGTTFERELTNALAQYLVAVEVPDDASDAAAAAERSWWTALRRVLGLGEAPPRILGFAGMWFTHDQAHIVTIAVDPTLQHRGIAQRLLFECLEHARGAESKTIALEVRPSNERARRLYEWFGFARVGLLRAYYSDNGEDAIVMLTPELDAPEFVARIEALRTADLTPRDRGAAEERSTRGSPS